MMKNYRTSFTKCLKEDNFMQKTNKIILHPLWIKNIDGIELLEDERIFCCHGKEHLFNVARIAYIENLEKNYGLSKDIIYAAAFLHDIGRYEEYKRGIPHEEAGVEISWQILDDCGFTDLETEEIIFAVKYHRKNKNHKNISYEKKCLSELIYMADKKSRMCMFCKATDICNWSEDRKNMSITV